jgi:hypothetical protein
VRVVAPSAVIVVCSVLVAAALLLVVPEGAVAHDGGGYLTEAEAAESLSAILTPQGDPKLDGCYGIDRPRKLGSRVAYRHFFCFYSTVTEAPGGTLEEPAVRAEVHVLQGGRLLIVKRVRNWESTPHWIDDPPPNRTPDVRGSTYGSALKRLKAVGFDRGDIDDDGLTLEIAGANFNTALSPRLIVCDVASRDSVGARTVTLSLGYRRCDGPPYRVPRLPAIRGMTLSAAARLLADRGISTYAYSMQTENTVRIGPRWVVCGYDRDTNADGDKRWDAVVVVSRDPCPKSWGKAPNG